MCGRREHRMRLSVHAVLLAGAALPAATAAQDGPPVEIRVTSAIYGAAQGSADVTPVVTRLVKPELTEFYAAPMWLEVDPAVGQTKQLVVFYEYRGEPRVLTTAEPGAVSYAILVERA